MVLMRPSRGFVLVIVLALLGVMAFLALDFVFRSGQSRKLSLQGLGLAKATLSARSGLEKGVQAAAISSRIPTSLLPYRLQLYCAGEDRNRNGFLDPGEDLDGDNRMSTLPLEKDLTPSLALEEAGGGRSLVVSVGGHTRGVTWRNAAADADQLCLLKVTVPCIDLNAGVEAGEGAVGQLYESEQGLPYTASEKTHPFNIPFLRFMNSWGNYHKYRAMVRYDKTYNFNRSNPAGLIDSPENLAGSLAESAHPITRFDDFNPSGNHVFDQGFGPVASEMPLGECLLNARPSGGFRSVEQALAVVENYVRSWTDKAGRSALGGGAAWQYADGGTIPVVDETRIRAIVEEFRDLASINPAREPGWVFRKGIPSAIPPNEPPVPGYFEHHDNRHYLYTRIYPVPALRVDVNRAPESVLAALVQAPGNLYMQAYNRSEARFDNPDSLIPFQSENNHPCVTSYQDSGGPYNWIKGNPLFSMTESIQMAKDIMVQRGQDLFQHSMRGLRDFLRSWRKGYDAKYYYAYALAHQFNTAQWGGPPSRFDEVHRFYDLFHGHRRVQILSELLNHHVNDARVVWDEALPLAVENRKNRLIITPDNPFKGRFFTLDEADGVNVEKGPEASFQSHSFSLASLGWYAPTGQSRLLTTKVRLFETHDIGTQKDFEETARDPATMATTLGSWVTYPEMTAGGVGASPWTGHLALKPSTQMCPWARKIRMRVPLNGYEPDPTTPVDESLAMIPAWTDSARVNVGPSALPARGVLRNSLNPAPGGVLKSLYPDVPADIDSASDLLPGGGIRMSPWHNSPMRAVGPGGEWYNSKEALLVLRNSLVEKADDDVLPDPNHSPINGVTDRVHSQHFEGAVSFYVKPRFMPELSHTLPATHPSGAVATLFYMPLSLRDEETYNRCLVDYPAAEAEIRSQFVGSLRLTWSQHNVFGDTLRQYSRAPSDNGHAWPAVTGFAGFPGQIAAGPFYFSGMEGITDVSGLGEMGFVMNRGLAFPGAMGLFFNTGACMPGGDGIEGHWRAMNPYSNEILVLEWEMHKQANNKEVVTDRLYPFNSSVLTHWGVWDVNDGYTTIQRMTAYQNSASAPLYLFDTSDPAAAEYHSVRKCFCLQGPKVVDSGMMGGVAGTGPVDRRGDLQALVEPGRWSHFFIVWRNLWAVLDNSPPSSGGCLAVYINGIYHKVSPQQYQTNAIFFNFDTSAAYRGYGGVGSMDNYSSWDPYQHQFYQAPTFNGPLRKMGGYSATKTFCIPAAMLVGGGASQPIYPSMPPMLDKGFGLEPSMYPYHGNDTGGVFAWYNENSPRKQLIHQRFPLRFYFGFEPHSIVQHSDGTFDGHSYFPANITWGSFMDVQVFDQLSQDATWTPMEADGGFLRQLPLYYDGATSFTPYPSLDTAMPARIFPLLNPQIARASGEGMLVGLSWSANLPEYHQFWDDQSAILGPDTDDVQILSFASIYKGSSLGMTTLSQMPSAAQWHHLEMATPLELTSPSDLELQVVFKGPEVVMSTPIIEGFELTFLRNQAQYEAIRME